MANPEYLKDFSSSLLEGIAWEDLLKQQTPITQTRLAHILLQANKFLISEPGPNLPRRRELTPDWLGWWTAYLLDKPRTGGVIAEFDEVSRLLERDKPSGVLFCGGLEGHRGQ